jgi:PTH2 family peptidyl-tRNA hydrolase
MKNLDSIEPNHNTAQIIVVRTDLKMSSGKMASQVAHASLAFLTRNLTKVNGAYDPHPGCVHPHQLHWTFNPTKQHIVAVESWLEHSFAKIVCFVDSLQELEDLRTKCLDCRMVVHRVEDSVLGTTTCIAIGPHYRVALDLVCSQLRTQRKP